MNTPKCDICKNYVRLADGRLLLKEDDVNRYWSHQLKFEEMANQANSKVRTGGFCHSITKETSMVNDAIPWHWGHKKCLPENRYVVIAKKFDNVSQLVDWTYHLLNDALVTKTNWRETIRRFYQLPAA
jgi:hypothetical protein